MANGTKKMSMFLAALFTAFTCMSYMPANAATKTTKTVVSAATVNYNAAVKAVVDYEKAIKGYKLTSKTNLDFCQAKYKVAMAALGKLNTKAASTKTLVNRVMAAKKVWDAAYANYLAVEAKNKEIAEAKAKAEKETQQAKALVEAYDSVSAYEKAPITSLEEITKAEALKQPAVDAIAKVEDEAKVKDLTARVEKRASEITAKKAELDKFRVVSVKSENALEAIVTFSKEVDKTSAETLANYSIAGKTIDSVKLLEDKKSVRITVNTATVLGGTMAYTVKPIALAADTTAKTPLFTAVETYKDSVAPQIVKVEYPVPTTAKVTFSEPISSLGQVYGLTAGTISTDKKTVEFSLAGLKENETKVVTIVGATDFAGNLINPNPATVSLTLTISDKTAPTVAEVTALSENRVQVKFSEELKSAPVVTVGTKAVTFEASEDNVTFVGTFDATGRPDSYLEVVTVAADFQDLSGNKGLQYTKLVQFVKDTTKPVYASAEVKTFNGKQYLVVSFNEAVAPTATTRVFKGTKVADYITYAFTAGSAVDVKAYTKANGFDADNSKAIVIDISDDTVFAPGTYTIVLPSSAVADKANNLMANDANISFVKNKTVAVETDAPKVSNIVFAADNSYATVTFDRDMDYATALNVNNYKVGGVCIFSNAIFDGSAKVVKLTVIPGTVVLTGDRYVTISGVKSKAGNVMTDYSVVKNVIENVKASIASAKLTSATTIAVKFSEEVTIDTADTSAFEIYVNGVKVDTTKYTNAVGRFDTFVITLDSSVAITDLSKTIQVKLVKTVVDNNGNKTTGSDFVTVTP
ncbi:hypothetical protein Q428_00180 [Fervidicella metallireducens AeB]|uniref:SbsA Ig-like domain-containing protein n=1 Tax=Fervidicella metallireducens AeB TaxID=1403537 RepID=A0A017S106_9CLOT|nr:hypothetical protein [Fervidicella metallireducens]EYE89860.1 hypothetical protein Q428_00180 [Fervidicella metallireducens AeB]